MSEENVLTAIQVSLGKIQVITENTERRIGSIEQRLDSYVPRREIEVTTEALESRVKGLEEDNKKHLYYLIGLLVTTLGTAGGMILKTLHG